MAKNKLSKLTTASGTLAMPRPYKPTTQDKARERRYQAEDALRTITRAEEIKRDKTLMGAVKQVAREQMKTLSSVTGRRSK